MLRENQKRGIRFEIFLEMLLRRMGHKKVFRNAEYHKDRYVFRQVDLSYFFTRNGRLYSAMVEAKYSSDGPIRLNLRNGEKVKAGQLSSIDNAVDEVLERKRFTEFDYAFLVTNKRFDEPLREYAKERGIITLDGEWLQRLYIRLGCKGMADDAILSIDLSRYNLRKSIIYL